MSDARRMQYDLIQGQGHGPFKVGNPAVFKSYIVRHLQWQLAITVTVNFRILCSTERAVIEVIFSGNSVFSTCSITLLYLTSYNWSKGWFIWFVSSLSHPSSRYFGFEWNCHLLNDANSAGFGHARQHKHISSLWWRQQLLLLWCWRWCNQHCPYDTIQYIYVLTKADEMASLI